MIFMLIISKGHNSANSPKFNKKISKSMTLTSRSPRGVGGGQKYKLNPSMG